MVDERVNKIINELVEELKSKYTDFKGIYLFGSHARGEATEDSDLDLAIIFDREIDWRFKNQINCIVSEKETIFDILIDAIILNIYEIIKPKEYLVYNLTKESIIYGF
jgi:predicted nucleotidyltransferase